MKSVAECKLEAFSFAVYVVCMILFNVPTCNMIHWRKLGHVAHL